MTLEDFAYTLNDDDVTTTVSGSGSSEVPSNQRTDGDEMIVMQPPSSPEAEIIELARDQEAAYERIVIERANTFVSGAAGSGKSFLIQRCVRALLELEDNAPDSVMVVAPTGLAAATLAVGARTVHSLMVLTTNGTLPDVNAHIEKMWFPVKRRWRRMRTLIIDEISMVGGSMLKFIDDVLRKVRGQMNRAFGGVQLVCVGDFCQLKPILDSWAFESTAWNEARMQRMRLTTKHRHSGDSRFANLLSRMRFAELTNEDIQVLKTREVAVAPPASQTTTLYGRYTNVDVLNQQELMRLDESSRHVYMTQVTCMLKNVSATLSAEKRQQRLAEARKRMLKDTGRGADSVELRMGARVMLMTNLDVRKNMVNGTLGRVVGFRQVHLGAPKWPLVDFEGVSQVKMIEPYVFSFDEETFTGSVARVPLMLAWALTVHKCQSLTLTSVTIDMSIKSMWDECMAYVGVGRVRTLNGLTIVNFDAHAIRANDAAIAYER